MRLQPMPPKNGGTAEARRYAEAHTICQTTQNGSA